jgi:hypothetical protein
MLTADSDDSSQARDERDAEVAAREASVGAREREVDARESVMAERADGTDALLEEAEERDSLAEFRDAAALHRDAAAAISDFFSQERPDIGTLRARGAAALDRTDARADRVASKKDRSQLTEAEQLELGGEG